MSAGEIGFETDTNKFKIGANDTDWANLAYAGGSELGNALTNVNSITAESGQDLVLSTAGAVLVQGGSQVDAQIHSASSAAGYSASYTAGVDGGYSWNASSGGVGIMSFDTDTEIAALVGIGTSAPRVTFSGVTGANASYVNGQVFYLGAVGSDDGYNFDMFLDAGLTQLSDPTIPEAGGLDNNSGAMLYEYSPGQIAVFELASGSAKLSLDNSDFVTYNGFDLLLAPSGVPVLPSYSNVSLPGGNAGSVAFVTNGINKPAYYDGSDWRYFNDDTVVS